MDPRINQSVRDLREIEAAVDNGFPGLKQSHPAVFAGLCRDAVRLHAARLVCSAIDDNTEAVNRLGPT